MKFVLLLILIFFFGCVPSAQQVTGSATVDSRTPTVSIASSTTVAENAGSTSIAVSINRTSTSTITIPFTIYGTATSGGTDYTIISGTTATSGAITISPGSLTGTKSLTITNDSTVEGNETMIVIFGTPTNAYMGSNTSQTITIIDDDVTSTLPNVGFSATFQTTTEASGSGISLTANLSGGPATFDVYVPFTVNATSTATSILEYSLSGNNIKIPAGSTTASITITVIEDTLFEGGSTTYETVIFNMGTPVNAVASSSAITQTLYIYDNESFPTVGFSSTTQSVTESNTTLTVTASLSTASSVPVYIQVAQTGGTASGAGIDYNFTPTTKSLVIPPNTLSTSTTFGVFNDSIYEGAVAETAILTLTVSAPAGVTVSSGTQTISITDSESAPTVNFNSSSITISETVGTVNIPVTMSGPSQNGYSLAYTVGGTATGVNGSPADHSLNTSTGGTLTVSPNSTSGFITFTMTNDNYGETSETILLTLAAGTGYSVGSTSSFAITLTDDDPTPTISFSQPTTTVTEGNSGSQTVTLTVSLSNPSGTTISAIMTESGSATGAGVDYTLSSTNVTIPPTASSTTVAISIVGETLYESNETLSLTLGTLSNANAGTYTSHTITITNDDSVPSLSFGVSATTMGEASGSSIIFTTTAAAISGADITVPYTLTGTATTGTDYSPPTSATGSISIPAGSQTGTVTITPTNDSISEGTETIILTTLTPTNASGTTTISISLLDNEPTPTVSFATTGSAITEESTTQIVTATLDYASSGYVYVPFTVSGSASNGTDYYLNAGTIVFAPGSTSQTVNTTIYEDTTDESTETVSISMTSATGASVSPSTSNHAISISDDDVLISFTSSSAITSEGAIVTMTMQVVDTPTNVAPVGGISGSLTFSGSATNGDYDIAPSSFSVTAGSGSTTMAISITQDTYNENSETINITMGSLSNAIAGTNPAIAITVNSSDPVTAMAIGFQHTCVLVNEDSSSNHVQCWGANDQYQTGDTDNANNIGDATGEVGATLASINFGVNPTAIAAGAYHTCAILSGVTPNVRCWGDGTYGQLGNGAAPADYASPVAVSVSGTAIQIAAGDNHTCILNSVGQVQCWGLNSSGQLGLDNNTTLTSPGNTVGLTLAAIQIVAGANHTCALLSNYTAKCWGSNTYGQLGIGSTSNMGDGTGEIAAIATVDLTTTAGFGGIASLSSGANHVCATSTDASTRVACWGYNGYGQLGQNNTSNYGTSTSPLGTSLSAIDFGGTIMSTIKAGGNFSCVIAASSSEAKCFGDNTYGQLGQEHTSTIGNGSSPLINSASFDSMDLPVTLDVSKIYLGGSHACAVINNGRIKCWGYNNKGQLGRGNTSTIGDGASEMGNSNPELNF